MLQNGVDVLGFLNAESGIGEAGRLLIDALRSVGYPVSALKAVGPSFRDAHPYKCENEWKYNKLIVSLNSPEMYDVVRKIKSQVATKDRVIGQWFWELEEYPQTMCAGFSVTNEVWAPTEFIATSIRSVAPRDVSVLCLPLPLLRPVVSDDLYRCDLGIEDDQFMFLYTFSYYSVFHRKNPSAVINAFTKAFKPNEGPVLVIKSIHSDSYSKYVTQLEQLTEGRKDIKFINKHINHDYMGALLSLTDCYVSLHRSEGLGLPLAQAMHLEKPVIATNYSGNTEFMNENNSILVPWKYTTVPKDARPYQFGAKWAEPDVNSAAEAMRWVYNNQKEAKNLGKNGRIHLETNFSLEKTGKAMVERLNSI